MRGACLLVALALCGSVYSHGHTHDHGHSHDEAPSHKYSRQANEDAPKKESAHGHDHGHSHGSHGHAHGSHGHAHGSQGHAHGSHDHGHSHGSHGHEHAQAGAKSGESPFVKAMLCTFGIGVLPVVMLLLVRVENTAEHHRTLNVLLAFASGGLLGDAFLHLIPHAAMHSGGEGHAHSHDGGEHNHDLSVGLWVLAGLITFLGVEMIVRSIKGGHSHGHSHGPAAAAQETPASGASPPAKKKKKDESKEAEERQRTTDDSASESPVAARRNPPPPKHKLSDDEKEPSDEATTEPEVEQPVAVAGYLNLAADFAHNFTDGLAIGASFLVSDGVGMITAFTIILHEVPHEIGDYAILIKSGVPRSRALALQLVTAVGAMLGTMVAFLAPGAGAATSTILPFTAGGFIYIATVSVIPDLLAESNLWQSLKQIVAMLAGIAMMIVIAYLE